MCLVQIPRWFWPVYSIIREAPFIVSDRKQICNAYAAREADMLREHRDDPFSRSDVPLLRNHIIAVVGLSLRTRRTQRYIVR